jgi:hypothetical protein
MFLALAVYPAGARFLLHCNGLGWRIGVIHRSKGETSELSIDSGSRAENQLGRTVSAPKIVTLAQQSVVFYQKRPESPKKAATAIVFGLP